MGFELNGIIKGFLKKHKFEMTVYSQKTGVKMAIKYAFYCLDKARN